VNETCKTTRTPIKDQSYKSWAYKKEEKFKVKVQKTYSTDIAETPQVLRKKW
jgi:hypothetical protein